MSIFSDLLEQYIKENDIKIYNLAAICQMDRSMLYRIISGKRNPPTLEIFQRIADNLQLAPAEYENLKSAYELTMLGETIYYRRKSVEKFFLDFPVHETVSFFHSPLENPSFFQHMSDTENACIPLSSKTEVAYYVHGILKQEASREKGNIKLLLQPDCPFLFGTLSSLHFTEQISITHVICLSKTSQFTEENQLYNLQYLQMMIPLFSSNLKYYPYYFYDDVIAHYHNFNGFPCMILTTEYAVVCTADYQKGFLYKGSSLLKLLHELYDSYQEESRPLFHVIDYLPVDSSLQQVYQTFPSYVIQPEACIIPLISEELLEKILYKELPDREAFIRQSSALIEANRQLLSPEKFSIYFTIPGLKHFLETGRIHEISEKIYRLLTPKERKEVLGNMLPYCRNGVYRLLKAPLNQLTENVHLVVNKNMGYLLFKDIRGQILCLTFNEPNLLNVFLDYAQSLEDGYLYTGEETEKAIQELLDTIPDAV